jgi:GDPmannose 4,6-dehydratase
MKAIVTGVTGMDGSHMSDFLLGKGIEVFGMVRRASNPNLINLKHAFEYPHFKLVNGDLTDPHSLDNLVKEIQPDYFFNFAAQSHVHESWRTPESTFDINATGTLRCLEAIRKFKPDCRFYSAGSSEQWGDVVYSPQNEEHPNRARSPYGASKVASQQLVKAYRDSYNIFAVHGLLLNHEGPRRSEAFVTRKITKGVARVFKAVMSYIHDNPDTHKDFEPIVLGNLDSYRDWSYAKDFIVGIWMMMNQDEINPQLKGHIQDFVLSSGEVHSVREFIEAAFAAARIPIVNVNPTKDAPSEDKNAVQVNYTLKNGTPVVVVSREFYRPAEVDYLQGDSTKIKELLGWNPCYSFDQLVKEMVFNDIQNAV